MAGRSVKRRIPDDWLADDVKPVKVCLFVFVFCWFWWCLFVFDLGEIVVSVFDGKMLEM